MQSNINQKHLRQGANLPLPFSTHELTYCMARAMKIEFKYQFTQCAIWEIGFSNEKTIQSEISLANKLNAITLWKGCTKDDTVALHHRLPEQVFYFS